MKEQRYNYFLEGIHSQSGQWVRLGRIGSLLTPEQADDFISIIMNDVMHERVTGQTRIIAPIDLDRNIFDPTKFDGLRCVT